MKDIEWRDYRDEFCIKLDLNYFRCFWLSRKIVLIFVMFW